MLYWCTGNPAPDLNGETRLRENLYSASVVALDPDTGEKQWHFQFTPHDVHDWDANEFPVLLDLEMDGKPGKLLVQSNRNGFYYVLDRASGEFMHATPVARSTWFAGIGSDGRPQILPNTAPTSEGNRQCPGMGGGSNWMAPSCNPGTGLLYVVAREECTNYFSSEQELEPGHFWLGSFPQVKPDEDTLGVVKALVPTSGQGQWEFKLHTPTWGGTLSTDGGVVFVGDMEGYLTALDAATGKSLWQFQTGAPITTAPMTCMLGDKQYLAIAAGSALYIPSP